MAGISPRNARDWLVIFSRAFLISLTASVIGASVESVPTLIHLFMCVVCDWSIGPLKSVPSAFLVVVHWLVGPALPARSCHYSVSVSRYRESVNGG